MEFNGTSHLVVVDYTSKYREVCRLGKSKTAGTIITKLRTMFGRFSIPKELLADDMPYASYQMQECAKRWGFTINTPSSPYIQSNDKAESLVKAAKMIIRKALEDPAMDSWHFYITGTLQRAV